MPASTRDPTDGQLAQSLPGPTILLTGHDQTSKTTKFLASRSVPWESFDSDKVAMGVAFSTQFPPDLNNDADVATHDEKMAHGRLGLVSAGGTVLRYVDFSPGYTCLMHRTQSVDYGIVVEGEIVAVLGSGEERVMARGDVCVQRATMHAWRNPSTTEWARMIFCLQDCQPLYINGERLGEDLGHEPAGIPPSGNDA